MHQGDQSKEPLSGEQAASGQSVDLGRAIYARYYDSPGILPLGLGPGLARQIYSFSEHLPLQRSVQQRWSTEGVLTNVPSGPLWHRALTSPRRGARSVAAKPRVQPTSDGLLPEPSLARPEGEGIVADPAAQAVKQEPSASDWTRSAGKDIVGGDDSRRSSTTTERIAAQFTPSDVARLSARRIGDDGVHSRIMESKDSASPAETMIHNSGQGIPSAPVQHRRDRDEAAPAKLTGDISRPVAQESHASTPNSIIAGKKLSPAVERSGSGAGAASPVQMGPPIFLRAARGTRLQTKPPNISFSEKSVERGDSNVADGSTSSPSRHDAPYRSGLVRASQPETRSASETILRRKEISTTRAVDPAMIAANRSPSKQIESSVARPANRVARVAEGQPHHAVEIANNTSPVSPNTSEQSGSPQHAVLGSRSTQAHDVNREGVADTIVSAKSLPEPPPPAFPLLLHEKDASNVARRRPLDSEIAGAETQAGAPIRPTRINVTTQLARTAGSVAEQISSTKPETEPACRGDRDSAFELSGRQRFDKASTERSSRRSDAIAVGSDQADGPQPIAVSETIPSAPTAGSTLGSTNGSTVPFLHRKEIESSARPSESTSVHRPVGLVAKGAIDPLVSRANLATTSRSRMVNAATEVNQSAEAVGAMASAIPSHRPQSSLLHRHTESLEARSIDSKKNVNINEAREAPAIQRRVGPSAAVAVESMLERPAESSVEPLLFAGAQVSEPSGSTPISADLGQIQTSNAGQVSSSETDQPGATVVSEMKPFGVCSERMQERTGEHRVHPNATTHSPSSVRQALVSSNTEVATPVLRKALRSPEVSMKAGSAAMASTLPLCFPGKSAAAHRAWARTDLALAQTGIQQAAIHHEMPHSPGSLNRLQRSAIDATPATSGQTASAIPSLSAQSKATSPTATPVDLTQLTDRVYEMLVRRLASEKQRRGM